MITERYRLRTPVSYWLGALALLAVGGFGLYASHRAGHGLHPVVLAIVIGAPLLVALATAPYRSWPAGYVAFGDDAVEVKHGRRTYRFAHADGIQLTTQQVQVRLTAALIPVAELDRGQIITLSSGSTAAKFSTLLVPEDERGALMTELERAARGLPPAAPVPAPPPRRTADDDRLDAELRDAD